VNAATAHLGCRPDGDLAAPAQFVQERPLANCRRAGIRVIEK
jgi:hypothetical protein